MSIFDDLAARAPEGIDHYCTDQRKRHLYAIQRDGFEGDLNAEDIDWILGVVTACLALRDIDCEKGEGLS